MTTESPTDGVCRDRLTGMAATVPEVAGTLIGRWVFDLGGQEVFINSVPASQNDFLVAEPSGHWYVLTEAGERIAGAVARAQTPDELEAESVRTIGDKLTEVVQDGGSWLEWLDVVPLVPGISEQVDLQPLELLVRENFGYLEAVCRKPRTHLHVEVERVPLSRARRLPVAAGAYLAAHTEDWDRRLIRGILPKRILAEVRHDQFDIYENRVTARLLDNLAAYLNRRIRAIKRLLKIFREKENYSSAMQGTYQRSQRVSKLWGESIDANEGRRKAEASLRELERLKYKLRGLSGSILYEEVPRRATVPTTLKSTNIFVNDQYYRRIAELWREWARTGAGRIQGPRELNDEAQRLCCGMDAFSMLLVVRSMASLGYEPFDPQIGEAIRRGTELRLQGHGVEFTLRWRDDGTISILFKGRELVIMALTTDLSAGTDKQVAAVLNRLKEAAPDQPLTDHLVLYLASNDERTTLDPYLGRSLYTVGNDPRSSLTGGGCLPVSPWEIGSTERLSRAVRWFLTGVRFLDYPKSVEVPTVARGLIKVPEHTRWLSSQAQGRCLEIRIPPQDYEWQQLDLGSLVEQIRSEATRAKDRHQRISKTLQVAVQNRQSLRTLNLEKSELQKKVQHLERTLKALQQVEAELQSARKFSTALLVCPTCSSEAHASGDFKPRDKGCFICICPGCRTEWSTRLCSLNHRYATMLPSGEFKDACDKVPGWEDRVYGGDILAVPARKPDGEWGYACPECGEVS